MADSQQGSGSSPSPDAHRSAELEQAALALDTAHIRLQDLQTSLRAFTAHSDRFGERARQGNRTRIAGSMGPDHSAIVFPDSDEESEIDLDLLRESLPARILELTSALDSSRRARLQLASSELRNDNSPSLAMSSSEEQRPIYPPLRRRRALPPVASSRGGGLTPPSSTSPARRSILEAHLRQLRHASNPGESTTTLGRRVAQRAAAASQGPTSEPQNPATTAAEPLDSILHATFPMDIEPRPSTSSMESRAASHLRYSLLPNPSGIRTSSGSRMGLNAGGAHPRFSERVEHRPRTARSNSLTALTRGSPPTTSQGNQQPDPFDASTQIPTPARRQVRATVVPMWGTDASLARDRVSELSSQDYRVRRRLNPQGEEHVFNIDWSELLSEEDGLSDPAAWMRPPHLPRAPRVRPGRAHPSQEPETDDTVQGYVPFFTREGREGSVQRRRGWARLNADGDEISTEDEATIERSGADTRMPRTRNRSLSGQWSGSIAVLDFVHRNSREATTGHRDVQSLDGGDDPLQPDENSRRMIKTMFCPPDAAAAYTSPLPIPIPEKAIHSQAQDFGREVQVTLNGRIAGR